MKKILKLVALTFILAIGILSVSQTTPASATVQDGFYVDNTLVVTVDEFKKMKTKEKINVLLTDNIFLIIGNSVLEANLILTATDNQITNAIMSIAEYEEKYGSLNPAEFFYVESIE